MFTANGLQELVPDLDHPNSCSAVDSARARLSHDIRVALRRSGHAELRAVEIEVSDDSLFITGQVPSYYLKQLAQEIARGIAPEFQILNHLAVQLPDMTPRRSVPR